MSLKHPSYFIHELIAEYLLLQFEEEGFNK